VSHDDQDWVGLYRVALTELEHAKMTGRIGDARASITARLEKLKEMPGLEAEERQAIEDALNGLKMLEREEERYQAEERRIAERALEELRRLGPTLEGSK
jgi:hypothetical protein